MTVATAARVFPHHRTDLQARVIFALWVIAILCLLAGISALAQEPLSSSQNARLDLPEAPQPVPAQALRGNQPLNASSPSSSAISQSNTSMMAPLYAKTIEPGYTAQPLTQRQEVDLGWHSLYTPFGVAGIGLAAGYAHLTNGQPNYGTDRGAFGQRLGAAVIRDSSQGLLSDVVLAPMLHEDARYYVEGNQRSFGHRLIYALTRTLVTRNNEGATTINGSLLLGYAGAAALTNAYYPPLNRNFHDTAATYGSSLGGNALGNVVHEFSGDLLTAVHLHKKNQY